MPRTRSGTWPTIAARSYDLRLRLDPVDPTDIVCELSPCLQDKLSDYDGLSIATVEVLTESDVLYEAPSITKYRSLAYLKTYLPSFLALRPYGLVKIGPYYLLFIDFVLESTLKEV